MDVLSAVGGKEREINTVFKKNFVCGLPMTKTLLSLSMYFPKGLGNLPYTLEL